MLPRKAAHLSQLKGLLKLDRKKKKLDRKDEKRPQPRKIQKKKLCSALSRWACNCAREDPAFFTEMASGQTPRYLWIGCSDSRVPANQIMNL